MDEPTASFSPREVERLFEIVRRLRDHDCAVIYVSHRLDEIFALCERATVMRGGRNVAERQVEGLTKERLIADIIGDDLSGHLAGRVFDLPDPGEPLLRVEGLQSDYIGPIDLTVRQGEIVGLGGLVGSGRSRLIKALYGVERRLAGSVEVDGRKLSRGTSAESVKAGLGLVPEDRGREGFMSALSIRENATLPTLRRFSRAFGFVRKRSQREAVEKVGSELRIKMASTEMPISGLSGGNQQKVVIAKWLLADSKLLIFDEPTRGIDIGAKEDVFRMMVDAARAGAGVIVASSELEELYGLCHRVLVMREGQMVGELAQDDATPQRILELCYGR
jgi:ABC-type sugar transport system ATPase subunit